MSLAVLILMIVLVLLVLYLPKDTDGMASARRLQVATGSSGVGTNHSGVQFAYSLPELLDGDNVIGDYHQVM